MKTLAFDSKVQLLNQMYSLDETSRNHDIFTNITTLEGVEKSKHLDPKSKSCVMKADGYLWMKIDNKLEQ